MSHKQREKTMCFRIPEIKSYNKVQITKTTYHWCKNEHTD